MTVWIAQCLCPQRHAIMAAAFDDRETAPAQGEKELRQAVEKLIEDGAINGYCHICESAQLTYETRRTIFTTLEQALPVLAMLAAAEIATRAKIDAEREPCD